MNETVFVTIAGIITVFINYATLYIIFPLRYSLYVSIGAPILFVAVFYTILLSTDIMPLIYGGFRGLIHVPVVMLLTRGQFFQQIFACFLVMLLSGLQVFSIARVVEFIFPVGSSEYYICCLVVVLLVYSLYFYLMLRFGRHLFQKMFINGRKFEWALYSFGAALSFSVLVVLRQTQVSLWQFFIVVLFIIWSFAVLCFAIISTHEKTKQRYDAEFAQNIISSGRDHYQKMNEMHDKLRILRHDYKYHLCATREMLRLGDSGGADNYLTDVEAELAEYDFLPNYCPNHVINALVASYAERASRLGIKFSVNISILKTLQVPNYEMCIIIGNLLENAMEACEKLDNGRAIELAAKSTNAQFIFKVKNSFNGAVSHNEGNPVSIKPNGGVGLKSVKAVAVRYGGDLFTHWDKDTFTAYVTVKV